MFPFPGPLRTFPLLPPQNPPPLLHHTPLPDTPRTTKPANPNPPSLARLSSRPHRASLTHQRRQPSAIAPGRRPARQPRPSPRRAPPAACLRLCPTTRPKPYQAPRHLSPAQAPCFEPAPTRPADAPCLCLMPPPATLPLRPFLAPGHGEGPPRIWARTGPGLGPFACRVWTWTWTRTGYGPVPPCGVSNRNAALQHWTRPRRSPAFARATERHGQAPTTPPLVAGRGSPPLRTPAAPRPPLPPPRSAAVTCSATLTYSATVTCHPTPRAASANRHPTPPRRAIATPCQAPRSAASESPKWLAERPARRLLRLSLALAGGPAGRQKP